MSSTVSSTAIIAHESLQDPYAELWFAEPAGFVSLPLTALLAAPETPAADRLHAAAAPLLASAPDEMARQQFIALLASGQRMLGALREFGTVHCSVGLHRDDVGGGAQPLLSLFTITWRDTATAPRAATAARAVTESAGHRHIEYLELSCGPLTISEVLRRPAAGSGLPQFPLLQVHAHLPHPDCKRLIVLTISSTAVARREEYRALLRGIVETVRFEDPMRVAS
ncbi:hypothetical protein KBY91_23125 [Streptomyces sp. RK23]|uniref:hypothetical protein n=1 Tax=Streptomyces TaxID=1883 RepID=UPI001B37ACA0|nr:MULTISPECIES: hypothetical protein [unclassified Streptomyces]MBQ0965893.1 hypothetical protein [Streptomyces sp. RK74B]MBQ1006295.1 hypothetical protein [Streptomyces sp. RK23]